jgi:hypothetical protein
VHTTLVVAGVTLLVGTLVALAAGPHRRIDA